MDAPTVSVLVLSMGAPERLRACLRALAEHLPSDVATEVLVLCNGATPELVAWARRHATGARVFVAPVNLGFGGGNDYLAARARGRWLVLLNDDAYVQAGWLQALLETAERYPRVGAVGSRLLFPDGRLQEAGSVVFSDGHTAPVGRGLPDGGRSWAFVRRVDYVSAASILLRREAFDQVGGFDPAYYPAYYEDLDLCLSLRRAGWDVLYDGRSVAVHEESASTRGVRFKHFLFRRNIEVLRAKWADELARRLPQPPPRPEHDVSGRVADVEPMVQLARRARIRILAVDDMLPLPSLGAGFIQLHNMTRNLGLDAVVDLHVTAHPGHDPVAVADQGVRVLPRAPKHLPGAPGATYDLVLLCRPGNARDNLPLARRDQPQARVAYFAEALFYRRLVRKAAVQTGRARARTTRQAARERRWELSVARRVDQVIGVSADEVAELRAASPGRRIDLVDPAPADIAVTPGGYAERRHVLFVPSWTAQGDRRGATPNEDALVWFVDAVLPHLVAAMPWFRLLVTGSDPPPRIAALASPHVVFTGYVADLRDVYAAAKVVVVPLRFGAGVKNKTVEALQYGVPTVATTVGAESIDLAGGRPIVVADEPTALATALTRLLLDPDEWAARRRDVERWCAAQAEAPAGGRPWRAVLGLPDPADDVLPEMASR